jgi:hypothetical protein
MGTGSILKARLVVAGALALAGVVAVAVAAQPVTLFPGGGSGKKDPGNDCFVEYTGISASTTTCSDCDPSCDHDSSTTPNGSCTFRISTCLHQQLAGCTDAVLKKVTVNKKKKVPLLTLPIDLTSSTCGAFTEVVVPTAHKGKKPGKLTIKVVATSDTKPKRTDKDTIKLVCNPQAAATCPAPTAVCGDGMVTEREHCDPPHHQGLCGAGQVCNDSCQCEATTACACGATTPTKLKFTTSTGTGDCGTAKDGGGTTLIPLTCGTLWFGAGMTPTPLPNLQPDLGVTFSKIDICSGTTIGLTNTTSSDAGVTNRTCTSANCLYGAPLPVPNPTASVLSTCVVNIVAKDAVGFGDCSTGEINLNLPLSSQLYLTGDLLDGTQPDRPDVTGIQPCPICVDDGLGTNRCKGGPNHGNACTPETSVLGEAYPTSQDCPPPGTAIGALSVPFALTTGAETKTQTTLGGQTNAFCGFCRDVDDTLAFQSPPVPCTSSADCTSDPVFEGCQQRDPGAFNNGDVAEITETGTSPGDLRDASGHTGTLVSVFCLPPSGVSIVDTAAGLPGPGATSLPGTAQLIP